MRQEALSLSPTVWYPAEMFSLSGLRPLDIQRFAQDSDWAGKKHHTPASSTMGLWFE